MSPTKSLMRELDHNIRGEEIAIRDYRKFYNRLIKEGHSKDAQVVLHIMREEEHHLTELKQRKAVWKRAI